MAENMIIIPEGKVRDYIDGTIRNETPEEYVRQTVEKRLVIEHKYTKRQIGIEYTVKMGNGKKRADIVVFPNNCTDEDKKDQHKIFIIIECKKEAVKPTDSKEGIEQLKTYMSACLNCKWGMWTNGKHKTVYKKVQTPLGIEFDECNDIPSADGSNNDDERPIRTSLTKATDDNLLFTFRTCHDIISVNEGHSKQAAFFEFLKIIFCKIQDERNVLKPIEFYTTSSERNYPDGQLSVKNRITKLFKEVKKRNSKIFDANDEIKLEPRTIAQIVGELQKYSLLNTNIDFKGKAYEEIVGSNLRGDRGEFFTPRNVMHMVVDMINPKEGEKVLDSSCGTGGFVVTAMNSVIAKLTAKMEQTYGNKEDWSGDIRKGFDDTISQIAAENFFGFDINPDLVKATKMNMVMNNDGSGNIKNINLRGSVPPEQIFIERIIQLLKPSGRAAIVLPDSIFSSPGLEFIRTWLLYNTRIIASIDLHADTFQPHNGTQCSVLFIVKKTESEKAEENRINQMPDYDIFMAMIEHIGHDKRGNTVYKRDDEGNFIMEHKEATVREVDHNGNITYRKESFDEKIINDQTILVADVFSKWKKEQGIIW